MAFDAFLKIEGIAGESAVRGMEKSIEVDSYSFGAQNAGSTATGAGAGKVDFTDISFVVRQSKATFQLLTSVASGKHHSTASLHLRTAGETTLEFLTLTLTDVIVTSLHESGAPGGDHPTDAFSLSFSKIQWTYTTQDAKGGAGETTQGSWDLKSNTA